MKTFARIGLLAYHKMIKSAGICCKEANRTPTGRPITDPDSVRDGYAITKTVMGVA